MNKITPIPGKIDFDFFSSQQFATVTFDRTEDDTKSTITTIQNGKINQFIGDNKYNPSQRRISTCTYIIEETSDKVVKFCTIQHKGQTVHQVLPVDQNEIEYLKIDPQRIKPSNKTSAKKQETFSQMAARLERENSKN